MPGETATKNLNVFILGLAFLGLFTAFNTMGNIQQTILDSAVNEELDEESGYVEGKSIDRKPRVGICSAQVRFYIRVKTIQYHRIST